MLKQHIVFSKKFAAGVRSQIAEQLAVGIMPFAIERSRTVEGIGTQFAIAYISRYSRPRIYPVPGHFTDQRSTDLFDQRLQFALALQLRADRLVECGIDCRFS